MADKLAEYQRAGTPLPTHHRYWPLYGAGFENLGREGQPARTLLPRFGPDELLVRHDAVGICYSDIKVIKAGEAHPRIYRDMRTDPVVLGHEVGLTIVGVGENLLAQFQVGARFVVQADIYVDGVSRAYGYDLPGGFSQYNVIGAWVLNGDHGCYLIPVSPSMGYAESALTEPWACVEAAYNPQYRTQWKDGGLVWIVGEGQGVQLGEAARWRPHHVLLNVGDAEFAAGIEAWGSKVAVEVHRGSPDPTWNEEAAFDDIIVLGANSDLVERAIPRLANGGVLNLVGAERLQRPVRVDVGRLHYDHLTLVGTQGADLSNAYTPLRSQLKSGGLLWVLGAAGPMGHMHIQRALEISDGPRKIVAVNLRRPRIREVERKFSDLAKERGSELVCRSAEAFSPEQWDTWLRRQTEGKGFDDIVVLAPSVSAIEAAVAHLSLGGVLNLFAGLPRGTQAALDLNLIGQRGVRLFGTSGSSIDDLRHMRDLTESHTLSPNRSVAAVAGLEGVAAGLHAIAEGRFPGKVLIFPNIMPLPLTPLEALEDVLPSVFERLKDGREWTIEAEREFLRQMLP